MKLKNYLPPASFDHLITAHNALSLLKDDMKHYEHSPFQMIKIEEALLIILDLKRLSNINPKPQKA